MTSPAAAWPSPRCVRPCPRREPHAWPHTPRLTPHTSAPAHQVHLGLEGVGTAALASTGYIGIVSLTHLVMFNPLAGDAAASIALPALSSDPTKVEFEIGSAEVGDPADGKTLALLSPRALKARSKAEEVTSTKDSNEVK